MTLHRILLLGSGGRESAIAQKLIESPRTQCLYVAPGNAGTSRAIQNVDLSLSDFDAIAHFVDQQQITMLIVGPEQPLVDGIVDYFRRQTRYKDLIVVGPSQRGAQLEGSKDVSKQFMYRHGIPTAAYQSFTRETLEEGVLFLETLQPPYVLKADGLAAGKGVLILENLEEAKHELRAMLEQAKFGKASQRVVIEQYLQGIEMSLFVLTDGEHYLILPEAKDYKRIGEGDTGLNTGGMGSVSPVPFMDKKLLDNIEQRIIRPTVRGLKQEEIDYKGFIFIGLMITAQGPMVIEYNVRMGDPETESVMPRLRSDMLEWFEAMHVGQLNRCTVESDPRTAVCVMCVAQGYPEAYPKGYVINYNDLILDDSLRLLHAGTRLNDQGQCVGIGGRVMALTALADTLEQARARVYSEIDHIQYESKYYRRDIGLDVS